MEHGGRKMRLAAGEWPRFSCCQADKWAFCARRALNFSLFLTKTNFFKPVLPEPHHYKLPSARTHWSTTKYVPISLEQTLSEPFRRVRAGTGRASPKGVMPDTCAKEATARHLQSIKGVGESRGGEP